MQNGSFYFEKAYKLKAMQKACRIWTVSLRTTVHESNKLNRWSSQQIHRKQFKEKRSTSPVIRSL